MEGMEGMTHNARLLEAMDYLMRSLDVSDDSLEELWLMEGVPDGTCSSEDFQDLADCTDLSDMRYIEDVFIRVLKLADECRRKDGSDCPIFYTEAGV